MLHQTQVPRVRDAWDAFANRFPTPQVTAAAGPGAVIAAWGRLGYPRRARWLWEASVIVARDGWPDDLRSLPGVGRYTAAALVAQADDADTIGVEVNIRRVCERVAGARLSEREAENVALDVARPLQGRDRLLALMDLGATVCTAREPTCAHCPIRASCRTRGALNGETRSRQGRFEGSFRQRRGIVMARLRAGAVRTEELDGVIGAWAKNHDLAQPIVGMPRYRPRCAARPKSNAKNSSWARADDTQRFGVGIVWPGFDDSGVAGWARSRFLFEAATSTSCDRS
jgi:A/G-specific adenine glycosylase